MDLSRTEKLKFFHGPEYSTGMWSSKKYSHCKLCKTVNKTGKNRHWAKGLCRSCYRRLSITHRLYNDSWTRQKFGLDSQDPDKIKEYKKLDPDLVIFDKKDIETLLDRYDWKCAYSGLPLQGYNHSRLDAFQVEYISEGDKIYLVPVCRKVNCSKKGLKDPIKLREWAESNGIVYPFKFILP